MRVLQLTSSYPREESDNSSIFLRHLFKHLADKGMEVHVLAPDDKKACHKNLDKNVDVHWFKYFPTRYQKLAYGSGILPNLKSNKILYLQVPFFLLSMFFSLLRLGIKLKPDIIHAHWIFPQGFIAVLAGYLLRTPVITTAHGGDAFALNNPLIRSAKIFALKFSKIWTSNTLATAQSLLRNKNVPAPVIIPMGVDTAHFRKIDNLTSIHNEKRKIILFVGRLVEKKGAKYLIEAFSLLEPELKNNCTLWIIGDGEERNKLEAITHDLNMMSFVRFFGSVNNNQLPEFYSAASIFVAPSVVDQAGDTEGQGVILLEAMACQVPIISTEIGGITEVVSNNKTGILVPQKNASALSSAIERLLNDRQLADTLSSRSLNEVRKRYQWNKIAVKFVDLYSQSF